MYLLLGNSHMETGDYKGAIQLFERARAQTRPHTSQALSVVSLVSFLMAILHRIEHLAIFGRYLDGTLTISTGYGKYCRRRHLSDRVYRYLGFG